jgi:hypothetical protein
MEKVETTIALGRNWSGPTTSRPSYGLAAHYRSRGALLHGGVGGGRSKSGEPGGEVGGGTGRGGQQRGGASILGLGGEGCSPEVASPQRRNLVTGTCR